MLTFRDSETSDVLVFDTLVEPYTYAIQFSQYSSKMATHALLSICLLTSLSANTLWANT